MLLFRLDRDVFWQLIKNPNDPDKFAWENPIVGGHRPYRPGDLENKRIVACERKEDLQIEENARCEFKRLNNLIEDPDCDPDDKEAINNEMAKQEAIIIGAEADRPSIAVAYENLHEYLEEEEPPSILPQRTRTRAVINKRAIPAERTLDPEQDKGIIAAPEQIPLPL